MSEARVGIVGAGVIAPSCRRPARFEDVEVRALADPVLERAEELAAYVSVAAYRSHLDMRDAEDLDAVYGGRPRSC